MKKALFTLCFAGLAAFSLQAQTPSSANIKPGTDAVPKSKESTTKATPATTKTGSEKSVTPSSKSTTAEKASVTPSTTKTSATAAPATKTSAAPAASTTPESKDYVKFDKFVHDYGTIKKGANGDCEFVFKNTGKEPLIIASCYGSCGCTVPKWPKEPLMPGKSTSINVHYDTNRPGPFEKTVTVNFQNHSDPSVLKIKGTVETPPADVPFGAQPANTGAPLERGN